MRITRGMLENYVSELNSVYAVSLSVTYFNGCTRIYNYGYLIESGTISECYWALQIFMDGFIAGVNSTINAEVV